jgi:hypothetical protein
MDRVAMDEFNLFHSKIDLSVHRSIAIHAIK